METVFGETRRPVRGSQVLDALRQEKSVTLPCGCLRGQVCCERASELIAACQVAFKEGMMKGDWKLFDRTRGILESHLAG